MYNSVLYVSFFRAVDGSSKLDLLPVTAVDFLSFFLRFSRLSEHGIFLRNLDEILSEFHEHLQKI